LELLQFKMIILLGGILGRDGWLLNRQPDIKETLQRSKEKQKPLNWRK
jgi:hypothetical protein